MLALTTGCSLLGDKESRRKMTESLPSPAKLVVDIASSPSPSLRRDWRPELSVMPYSELGGERVTVRNVRRCRWRSETDYDVKHDDWKFDWDDVENVDFIVVPFDDTPSLAHTMLSFGLRDGRHLALSVEARLEAGETYSPLSGTAQQYDLMYVLGDEIDLIGLRAEVRRNDIYLYRSRATPEQSAAILRSVLQRANKLATQPEFYDSLRNSCATNVADHIQPFASKSIVNDWRLMLPGHSDKLAYDLKLIDTSKPFEQIRREAYVSLKARQYLDDQSNVKKFSKKIRR